MRNFAINLSMMAGMVLMLYSQSLLAEKSDSLLLKANVSQVGNRILIYGFYETSASLQLYCNYYSESVDSSVKIELGNFKSNDFHEIGFDTVHGFLNFRIQKKDNDQTCTVVRLNKKLELIVLIKDVNATRLNSFWIFNQERLFYKNSLYIVKAMKDSLGKFYLQKYHVKDTMKSFEYEQDWQFNFHKNKYQGCNLIYADSNFVWLFVNSREGDKKGQWIIKLRTFDGDLELARKLNEQANGKTFVFSSSYYDKVKDEMVVAGLAFDNKAIVDSLNTFDVDPAKKTFKYFVFSLTAMGDYNFKIMKDISPKYYGGLDKAQKKAVLKINKIAVTPETIKLETEFVQERLSGLYSTCGLGRLEYTLGMNGEELFRDDYYPLVEKGKYAFFKDNKEALLNDYDLKDSTESIYTLLRKQPDYKGVLFLQTGDKLAWLSYRKDVSTGSVVYGNHNYVKGKPANTVFATYHSSLRPALFVEKKGRVILFRRMTEERGYVITSKDW